MRIILFLFVVYSESNNSLNMLRIIIVVTSVFYFGCSNLLLFYMLFEFLLFPMILMIYYFGSQPEKVGSVYYAVIYTGVFRLPFMWQIIKIEGWILSFHISPICELLFLGMFLSKIPMFGLHFWLPKAHVEAPTSASILLAGVLLKVGFYGFIKATIFTSSINLIVFLLSFMRLFISPIFAICRRESKVIVAYSSVNHINLGLYGLNLLSSFTFNGGFVMSLRHGFISRLVFCLVGNLYRLNGTRILYYMGSLLLVSGFITFLVSLVLLGNAGVPPLLRFWGEVFIFFTLLRRFINLWVFLLFGFILRFYYRVFLLIHLIKPGVRIIFSLSLTITLSLGACLLIVMFYLI